MKPETVLKYIALIEMCSTKQDLATWECAFGGKVEEAKDKIVRFQEVKEYLISRIEMQK